MYEIASQILEIKSEKYDILSWIFEISSEI